MMCNHAEWRRTERQQDTADAFAGHKHSSQAERRVANMRSYEAGKMASGLHIRRLQTAS